MRPTVPAGRLPDPTGADPLAEALKGLRLSGALYCSAEFSAPWGVEVPAFDDVMMFILVTAGALFLEVDGEASRRLDADSFVLLPRRGSVRLRSAPGVALSPLSDVPVEAISSQYETSRFGGGGAVTHALYGVLRVEHTSARLASLLPPVLPLDTTADDDVGRWTAGTVHVLTREARAARPGSEVVVTRLADVLVVHVIRAWLDSVDANAGWIAALRDPQLGRALSAVHRAPAEPWTLQRLAKEAGMSRSLFARRFAELVGQPPLAYVTDWRMRLARVWLRDETATVAEVAARAGYGSPASFGRAFRQTFGEAPGTLRQHDRRLV